MKKNYASSWLFTKIVMSAVINPLNAELNPICHLLELLGAHPILHISRIRVKYKFRTSSKKNSKLRIIYWYIERV